MALSMAAKAALCVCPPALMATGVATIPAVKRAVHHATAPRTGPKPVHRVTKAVSPKAVAQVPEAKVAEDCVAAAGGPLPEVPLVTYAAPIADEPGGGGDGSFSTGGPGATAVVGIGGGGGGSGPSTPVITTPGGTTPGAGAVPETPIWLMMISGVGALGASLRLRRRRVVAFAGPAGSVARGSTGRATARVARRGIAGGALWSGSVAVEAGDLATTVAVKSAVASAAGKALLCVCPAIAVAGSVMTVPPLRQAVHAATIGAEPVTPAIVAPQTTVAPPCIEVVPVPVATTSIDGFPAAVETMPVVTPMTVTPLAARPAAVAQTI